MQVPGKFEGLTSCTSHMLVSLGLFHLVRVASWKVVAQQHSSCRRVKSDIGEGWGLG